MKIITKVVQNESFIHDGFSQGSNTDRDVIARACGALSGNSLVTAKVSLEDEKNHYELTVSYETQGEQKILEIDDLTELSREIQEDEDVIDSICSSARKCKVSGAKNVAILSKILSARPELLGLNCWYEGVISLSKKNKESGVTTQLESNMFESDLGLDGVAGSIQEIHEKYKDDKTIIELVEWLLNLER